MRLGPADAGERRALLGFFVAAAAILLVGYGLRDPWPADEPRFVLVAQQMLASGDWWFPQRGQELYADKPPLYFWLLAAAKGLIGDWRWSFLLPSLLAALATLYLTFDIGRRLHDVRTGLWAAGAVLLSAQFVYQAKRAQIDPTLMGLTTLSLWALLRWRLLDPRQRWLWLGGIAAGLGVVAKGVGFLPLLLLPLAAVLARAGYALPPRRGSWWALPAALAAIAAWLLPMSALALFDGDAAHRQYLHELLFRQTVTRYAEAWHHVQPWWYFVEVVALAWLPFSLLWPWLLAPWRAAWRARDARIVLPLAWALSVVLFFSSSAGKRDMYILPALPAFALAAAPYLPDLCARRSVRAVLLAFGLLLGTLLLAAGVAALFGEPRFELRIEAERGLAVDSDVLWAWLAVIGAAIVGSALLLRRRALAAVALGMALLWSGWSTGLTRVLDAQNSARALMQAARAEAGPDTTIGLVQWKEQNLLQAVGPVAEFGFRVAPGVQFARALAWQRAAPLERVLMVYDEAVPACVERARAQRLGTANRRHYWLLREAALAECALPR